MTRRRRKVLYISVTEEEHLAIAQIAKKNRRTINDEVWRRLRSTLDDTLNEEDVEEMRLKKIEQRLDELERWRRELEEGIAKLRVASFGAAAFSDEIT